LFIPVIAIVHYGNNLFMYWIFYDHTFVLINASSSRVPRPSVLFTYLLLTYLVTYMATYVTSFIPIFIIVINMYEIS